MTPTRWPFPPVSIVRVLFLVPVFAALLLTASPARAAGPSASPLPSDQGPFLGALLDWANDSPEAYEQRLGTSAALYGRTVPMPMSGQEQGYLRSYFGQIAAQGAHALITIRPEVPLIDVDAPLASALAEQIADVAREYKGTVFVRFAPQMNASWVPWGQQPEPYREAFRVVAAAMEDKLGDPVMVWSPTAAEDYPFRDPSRTSPSGGPLGALDTDGNGEWDFDDDAYSPYYPGDDVVDWVGLSAYHDETDGVSVRNSVPGSGKFQTMLGPVSSGGPPSPEDFYAGYASGRGKSMMVETAAFYSAAIGGASEQDIKASWWDQVLVAPGRGYDLIDAVVWNETTEQRQNVAVSVDWRATDKPELARSLAQRIRANGLTTGPVVQPTTLEGVVPAAPGSVLNGFAAWTTAGAVLAMALALCLLPKWRPAREWAYAGTSSRDTRIDMLRGVAIVFVVVNHMGLTSLFQLLTQETIGVVSGAELFVLLSGAALGLVHGPRVKDNLGDVVDRTSKRAWKLYVTALAVALLIFALSRLPFLNATAVTTFTDQGAGAAGAGAAGTTYDLYGGMEGLFQFPLPEHLLPSLLLLQVGPWQFNVMGLYVILLAISPLVLLALSRGRAWLVLTITLGLYAVGAITKFRLLPSQFEDSFPLLVWQVLFVLGISAGYYRRHIVVWFSHPRQRVLLWACMLMAAALAVFSWTSPYLTNAYDIRLALLSEQTFRTVYDGFFGRTYLGPGRLLNVLLVIIAGYALLSAFWKPLERAAGWFLVPLGQATLYVFVLHVFLILAVTNIPALQQGNIWLNTAAYILILALLWLMVRTRFLFQITPR